MKITAEEQLMYNVMKAIYESGIPISFKGSMVQKHVLWKQGSRMTPVIPSILTRTGTPMSGRLENRWRSPFKRHSVAAKSI